MVIASDYSGFDPSSDIEEFVRRQMEQCCLKYFKKSKKFPILEVFFIAAVHLVEEPSWGTPN